MARNDKGLSHIDETGWGAVISPEQACEVCGEQATVITNDICVFEHNGIRIHLLALSDKASHYTCEKHKVESSIVEPTSRDIEAFRNYLEEMKRKFES